METDRAEQIHDASLSLLWNPGVRLEHEGIVKRLLEAGAKAGSEPDVIRVPKELVSECLARCPKDVALTDREGNATVLAADSPPAIWSCPGMNITDGDGVRPSRSTDLARTARLLDGLEHVQGVFGMAMGDLPPKACDVAGLNVMANNTKKHLRAFCFTPDGGRTMARMKAVVGDHPWFSVGFTAHGPLRWTRLALEIFEATSGHGIPATVNGEPMAGTSGPVTLAGSAAIGNAEILAGLIALQLMEPGRPCIYNLGLAHIFDMRTSIAVTGGPENALFAKLSAEMGRFYDLPSGSWVSTESMCVDSQSAMEKMFGFQTHMAEGVSNIWGVGQLESELTVSPAQAVIDNEMIGYAKRFQRGVTVDEESLAVDVSREVGIGGSYLGEDHTAENYRSEFFMPSVLFRKRRPDWESAGRLTMRDRADAIAEKLMSREVNTGLTADQVAALQGITDEFMAKHCDGQLSVA